MGIRGIVFDYGHTLIDLVPIEDLVGPYRDGVRDILARSHPHHPDLPNIAERVVMSMEDAVETSFTTHRQIEEIDLIQVVGEALQKEGLSPEESDVHDIVEMDHQLHGLLSVVPNETLATLEKLKARDIRLGVMSNTVFLRRWVHHLPFLTTDDTPLDGFVLSSDLGIRKPHASAYAAALADIGVAKDEAVFVGDRMIEDIRGPRDFGFASTVLTHEFRQEDDTQNEADATITRLEQLLDFIG